jgi:hypothetical protein
LEQAADRLGVMAGQLEMSCVDSCFRFSGFVVTTHLNVGQLPVGGEIARVAWILDFGGAETTWVGVVFAGEHQR